MCPFKLLFWKDIFENRSVMAVFEFPESRESSTGMQGLSFYHGVFPSFNVFEINWGMLKSYYATTTLNRPFLSSFLFSSFLSFLFYFLVLLSPPPFYPFLVSVLLSHYPMPPHLCWLCSVCTTSIYRPPYTSCRLSFLYAAKFRPG